MPQGRERVAVITGPVVTEEDAAEWRLRMENVTTPSSWLSRLLGNLDPPRRRLAVSTFRWTRLGVVVAVAFGIWNVLSTPNDYRSLQHFGSVTVGPGTPGSSPSNEIAYSVGLTGEKPTLAKPFILGLSALGGPDVLQ